MNLLFVCTGNTCRSPLAEAIARAEAARRGLEGVRCRSAGTSAFPGHPASAVGIVAAAERGIDLEGHRSRPLDRELVEWADAVLVMARWHGETVLAENPEAPVALLTRYLPAGHEARDRDVPDPIGGDLETYAGTFDVLAAAIDGLFDSWDASSGDERDDDGRDGT